MNKNTKIVIIIVALVIVSVCVGVGVSNKANNDNKEEELSSSSCSSLISESITELSAQQSTILSTTDNKQDLTTVIESSNVNQSSPKNDKTTKPKPAATIKPETKPNVDIKDTTQPPQTTTEAPFDINYYIDYGKSYATKIGLELDSTAYECWDTPITSNNPDILKRDIESRLNRYKNVEGFTAVWIWAEKTGNNRYDLYIGYA